MKNEVALKIENLSAGYDGEMIIKDIDLKVEHGDFFGLIGPNGGGKSTLLKAILGLIQPAKGSIRVYGFDPSRGRKFVGYVPQYSSFDKDFPITVQNVVMMGRRRSKGVRPWYSGRDLEVVKDSLSKVDMQEHIDRHINALSGGQKQRVFIARALASEPRMLLLDEPTASVDATIEESIYKLLTELNKDMTIILVTHDIGIISSHVGTVACLNRHLFTNNDQNITADMLERAYQCPVDLIAHGVPHRVLPPHDHGG
ncbi:MAG: ABC transporter ATP-binding protein [Candidatus Thermoplasmatota archaeon]|nr:ABC transporter ATP-binding protein [Candidatus Thermoplasmatota archaeon]